MEISNRDAGEVKVVEIEGHLDSSTSPTAKQHLDELVGGGSNKILINFEKLIYISSAGLHVLLGTVKKLRANGGDLRLCSINQNAREVFEVSGFSSILSVHPSETEALEGF